MPSAFFYFNNFLKGLKMSTHKVKVLEEAFYKGAIRPVDSIIDYEGDKIPSWATLASGQASTVKTKLPIENPVKTSAKTGKNTGKSAPQLKTKGGFTTVPVKSEEQAAKNPATVITIENLPDDKKAELTARAIEAGITGDISSLTLEAFEAEILKRNEEKQLARLEELKAIAAEKNIEFEETEAPIAERIAELEEKINAQNGGAEQ